ncbi:MAG: class I SAM-dependent methyltransferase [Pseudomonadota bacterium]
MNDRAFEHYDEHYRRLTAYRRSKVLTVPELARDRAPRWLHRLPKDAHILDYGCADGYMLWVLHTLGYHNLVGADISESVLRHARTRLAGTSVELRDITSDSLDDCAGRFDAIIMHQVLEHIPREETVPTLTRLYELSKPGGLISVAVPNAASLLGEFNFAVDFTHKVSFTEYSLEQVLELSGFERAEIVFHRPKLFASFRNPLRMGKRFLNRVRYSLNSGLHYAMYILRDERLMPRCFESNLELVAFRPE